MALPLYLAMTAAEMQAYTPYPEHLGYMAVHFSPNDTGLSNIPREMPDNTMLILNDQIPWDAHDPERITRQLLEILPNRKWESLLLDFQRPGVEELSALARSIFDRLPCPVAVSHLYAGDLPCPVFLPPVPLTRSLRDHLSPWKDREIWLEAALDGSEITLTEEGCHTEEIPYPTTQEGHTHSRLHCHYTIETARNKAVFTLFRTRQDLTDLLEEAQSLGIARAVGLWQELGGT